MKRPIKFINHISTYFYVRNGELKKGKIISQTITLMKNKVICEMSGGDWVYIEDLETDRNKIMQKHNINF